MTIQPVYGYRHAPRTRAEWKALWSLTRRAGLYHRFVGTVDVGVTGVMRTSGHPRAHSAGCLNAAALARRLDPSLARMMIHSARNRRLFLAWTS